ncbi:MAG: hypothetical protein ACRDJP_09505, partial [Actinomycetota bacterium]
MGVGAPGPRPPAHQLVAVLGIVLLVAACTRPPGERQPRSGPVPGPSVSVTPPSTLRVSVTAPTSLDPAAADTQDSLL